MLFSYVVKASFLLTILALGYRWLVQFTPFSKVNQLLLLVVIPISTAFVAPDKNNPAVEVMVPGSLHELAITIKSTNHNKTDTITPPKKGLAPLSAISESKFCLKRNDTLYWAISPLASLEDLEQLRQELKTIGTDLEIKDLQLDSQQRFISLITITIKAQKSNRSSSGGETPGIDLPINGYTGYSTKETFKITEEIPQELFIRILKDRETALNLAKGEAYFAMHSLLRELKEKKIKFRSTTIRPNGPSLASQIYSGVENAQKEYEKSASEQNILSIIGLAEDQLGINIYKNTAYYINTKLTTADELSKLSLSQVKEVHRIIESANSQKHLFVITK